jgi:hypothetical protein
MQQRAIEAESKPKQEAANCEGRGAKVAEVAERRKRSGTVARAERGGDGGDREGEGHGLLAKLLQRHC